ncbi:(Fe-S)-binding protein [Methanothermococcus okinawensis]|uniref:Fe-S cluster domain protein n=1 Tax=Methanothermococcus okinawensis (strain DSM 14208 / JCM 11175 / IH1) TaxID=647113 RepID=F8ANA4_METOI|nr:(Fe-S)-binding protein [Methanothermococcus okinawensis]AEH06163.1 Fe-S cluster domain protein [Methanothermococcus okinawensis IH1]
MGVDKSDKLNKIIKLLPGYNCRACGYKRCDIFAEELLNGRTSLDKCPFLFREDFKQNMIELKELLKDVEYKEVKSEAEEEEKLVGVIDEYEADFLLDPLPNEHSCRETLMIADKKPLKIGDYIQYRPLGCPIPHFAKIIDENHGLYIVHIEGPCHRITGKEKEYINVGIAMVVAFEGIVIGKVPEVGHTVKFIPNHCMMQKVHSGVVVEVEGNRAYIEGIDLKVW